MNLCIVNDVMPHDLPAPVSRRQMLRQCGAGFGQLALLGLMSSLGKATAASKVNPLAARPAMFPARAKRVIFLFMHGGPSHVDTFDYKPALIRDSGKPCPSKSRASSSPRLPTCASRRGNSGPTARAAR